MRRLVAWIIWLAFALRLRRPLNHFQQWRAGEHKAPRSPLPRFDRPESAVRWARAHFAHRKDKSVGRFGAVDWSTEPEVFQARLESFSPGAGDCDDYHQWCAEVLTRIPEVEDVLRLSLWTWERGHTVCVYLFDGHWWLVDYDLYRVDSPKAALENVARRREYGELDGWVFETVDLDLVAVWPRTP